MDYMAEHLTATGRAGFIVPEGIIFQSQNAYKQLRKLLVEESFSSSRLAARRCLQPLFRREDLGSCSWIKR